jgi:hemoglobin
MPERETITTFYDQLGGEAALRAIIDDFVERVFADTMIGFFFRDVPIKRIKELEFQHAAELLGGPVPYKGRPLREAHAKHPIMGG